METALIEGRVRPAEAPEAWNARFKELLGVDVPNNAQGCLQDVHWSEGLFGYFPTYTLGNLYAAQFFAQARAEISGLDEALRAGEFLPLRDWLRANIHRHGMRYRAGRLCEKVTGRPLSAAPFREHLTAKVGALYGLA